MNFVSEGDDGEAAVEPEKFSWSPVKSRRCRSSVSCSANGGATVQRNWRRQRQLRRADVTLLLRWTNKLTIPKSIKVYFTKSDEGYIDRYQMSMHFVQPLTEGLES